MREALGVDIFEDIYSLDAVCKRNHGEAVVVEKVQCQLGGWRKVEREKVAAIWRFNAASTLKCHSVYGYCAPCYITQTYCEYHISRNARRRLTVSNLAMAHPAQQLLHVCRSCRQSLRSSNWTKFTRSFNTSLSRQKGADVSYPALMGSMD